MPDSLRRLAPLTGVVFAVLLAVTFILTWNTPGIHDSGLKVISYYKAHNGRLLLGNFLGAVSVGFFLFFVASLRSYLRQFPGAEGPSALALAGATLLGVGGTIFSSLSFALGDARNSISPAAAEAINVLNIDFFWPFTIGVAVFGIGIGLTIVNSGALPKWLGWVAFVLGVVAFTPVGFFSFIVFLPWSAAVGIMIYMRRDAAPSAAAPGPPVAT